MNPPPLNPHCFRKMKQAETNMVRLFFVRGYASRKRHRRTRYWANQFQKWLDKLITV